jgi:hypothetical protein
MLPPNPVNSNRLPHRVSEKDGKKTLDVSEIEMIGKPAEKEAKKAA